MRHHELLVFDLDDTLVDTSDVYWRARTGFVQALATQGIDPDTATEEFEKVDTLHIETMLFAPQLYGKSMSVTYSNLLEQLNLAPSVIILEQITVLGRYVLDHLPEPIDGAHELLDWAVKRFQLALLTRGEDKLQRRKLEKARLSKYFDIVQVVPYKDATTFRTIIKEADQQPEATWVIGDSIKSDINPGLNAGAQCILYAYRHASYQWRQEYGYSPVKPFYIINKLREAKDLLETPRSFLMNATMKSLRTI